MTKTKDNTDPEKIFKSNPKKNNLSVSHYIYNML